MQARSSLALWIGAAFGAQLTLTAAVFASRGLDEHGTHTALFLTARLSFLLFWLAYTGSALRVLFGPIFQPLKRHAREFGLAFASAQIVHLSLVGWLYINGKTPGVAVVGMFGVATIFIYTLALFSFAPLRQMLGDRGWRVLQVVGMNYILYVFAVDFMKHPVDGGLRHTIEYLPFVVLAIAAPTLRLAAMALSVGQSWRRSSPSAG